MAKNLRSLQFKHYLGFGLGDFAFNLFFQGTTLFLLFFYTDILGIAATTAGTIFLIATFWDAVSDPLMGYVAGKTRSRWGRYRPYLLWIPIPLGLSYVLMFYHPDLSGMALMIWVTVIQILFRTFFTIGNIPYSSLSSEMTHDAQERSQLAAYRMFLGYAGALLVSVGTSQLMSNMGWIPTENGYFYVAILFSVLAALLFLICFKNTFELSKPTQQVSQSTSISKIFKMLINNEPFVLLCGFIMLGMAGVIIFYQSLAYYFKYNLQDEAALGTGMLSLFTCLMLSLPLWFKLSVAKGKRNTLILGCVVILIGSLSFYLNPLAENDLMWVYVHMSMIGTGIGCAAFSFWAMLPDTVEYGEWKSGIRAEAVLFGLGLFFLKLALGIGSFVLGVLLDFHEYNPNAVQTAATLKGLHDIVTLAMVLPAVGIIVLMLNYSLTENKHLEILEKLEKVRS